MSYTEFLDEMSRRVGEQLGKEYQVGPKENLKNNSVRMLGLQIKKEGVESSPVFYLNCYYEQHLEGAKVEELADKLVEAYHKLDQNPPDRVSQYMQLENCEDKIAYRLVSKELNEKLLETIPSIDFLDLSIIFIIVCRKQDEFVETIRVTNQMIDNWGIKVSDLFRIAHKNTKELFPVKFRRLDEVIQDLVARNKDTEKAIEYMESPFFILSNESGVNGAASLIYPGILEGIAKKLESDLFVLPSSIHEVLLLPADKAFGRDELSNLVKEVNRTQVLTEEVLSNQAYRYEKDTRKFQYT